MLFYVGKYEKGYLATMTSVAFMTASTLLPTFMSKSSAASLEINVVTMQGTFTSTLIIAVKPSFSTANTFPFKRFLALIFNPIARGWRSFNEMGLNLNTEVFLAFKASSVQMI
jgi:hypothetical protein